MTSLVLRLGALAAPLAAYVLYEVAGAAGSSGLVLAAAAFAVLPVVAAVLRPTADLVVGRAMPARLPLGAEVPVELVVENRGRRWSGAAVVTDTAGGLDDVRVAVPPLPPGGVVRLPVQRTAVRRGRFAAGSVLVLQSAPFAVLQRLHRHDLEGEFTVHPAPAPPYRLTAVGDRDGERPTGRAGRGTDPLQLREWRPGDGARSVHARASARHGRALVLDREDARAERLVLLLCGPGEGEEWERVLARACSAAVRAVRDGTPVLLLAAGRRTPEALDVPSVLDWFAEADDVAPLDDAVLAEAVRAGAASGGVLALAPADGADVPGRLRRAGSAARCPVVVVGG